MPRFVAFLLMLSISISAFTQADAKAKRLDTIRYGIESQLLDLLNTLIAEKSDDFNDELVLLLATTKSPKFKSALLNFFSGRKYFPVQDDAVSMIRNRDSETETVVISALNYLINLKSVIARSEVKEIIANKELKYLNLSIKLLSYSGLEDDAALLIELFKEEETLMPVRHEIILALGTLKYKPSMDLLESILGSETATKTEKIYACVALGKMEDEGAVPLLVAASILDDPNVRASAVQALENYKGDIVERILLEALKDSHVAVRLAAVSAVAKLRMVNAIPYLKFKIQSDPEKAVKDMSIFALGEIGGDEVDAYLSDYLPDVKILLQHRLKAFRVSVEKDFSKSKSACLKLFTESAIQKDKSVYLALAKVCTSSESMNFTPFIKILLNDNDFNYRLGALVWIDKNKVKEFAAEVKNLSEKDPVETVKKKASQVIEKLYD